MEDPGFIARHGQEINLAKPRFSLLQNEEPVSYSMVARVLSRS
jgi:hypothetical protein